MIFIHSKQGQYRCALVLMAFFLSPLLCVPAQSNELSAGVSSPKNQFSGREMRPGSMAAEQAGMAEVMLYFHNSEGRIMDELRGSIVTFKPDSGSLPVIAVISEDGMANAFVSPGGYIISVKLSKKGQPISVHRTIDQRGGTAIVSILL